MHDFSTVRLVENRERLPWSLYVGVLGMPGEQSVVRDCHKRRGWYLLGVSPGQTAYYGWSEFARPKKVGHGFIRARGTLG